MAATFPFFCPLIIVAGLLLSAVSIAGQQESAPAAALQSTNLVEVTLEGRVVCLAEELHRRHQAILPPNHEHLYGFKTADGTCYTLLRTKLSEALFADERVRAKLLRLRGRVFPKTQVLEVSGIRSVKSGVIHDLFYYCGVCEITTAGPGLCDCCQDPMELVEKPLP